MKDFDEIEDLFYATFFMVPINFLEKIIDPWVENIKNSDCMCKIIKSLCFVIFYIVFLTPFAIIYAIILGFLLI